MRRLVIGFAAMAVAGGLIWAGEECCQTKCNVGEKLTKVLSSWQTAAEAEKAGCAEERAKLNTEIDALAKQCPIGSRVGETLAFVRTALETAVKADEECAKACAAKTDAAAAPAIPADMAKLAEERAKLVKDLHQLVSYATGGGCEKACAAKPVETAVKTGLCEKKVAEVVASVRADACEVSAAKTVLASVEGLGCEKKAGEIAAAIRAESCPLKAGEILAKAASEVCASKKPAAVETAVKTGLCEKKVAEVVASVRADQCEVSAAKTVLASVEGLGCEKKAGEIAAAIRAESCSVKAGEILAKAASEVCASKKPAAVETAVKTEACAKTCATSEACCKEIASRAQALKASWEKAGSELTSMCPTKRKELQTSFAGLQGRSKTLALMPDTLSALAMGIDRVHGINAKMVEWAKANPDALKGMSAEAHTAFTSQLAAIGEAREVLAKMSAATTCSAPCTEKKTTETTTSVK